MVVDKHSLILMVETKKEPYSSVQLQSFLKDYLLLLSHLFHVPTLR